MEMLSSTTKPHHDPHELTTQPVLILAVNNTVTDPAPLNITAANEVYDYPLLTNTAATQTNTAHGAVIYTTVDEECEVSTQPITTTTNEAYGVTIHPLPTNYVLKTMTTFKNTSGHIFALTILPCVCVCVCVWPGEPPHLIWKSMNCSVCTARWT